jgi:hypothetical protein
LVSPSLNIHPMRMASPQRLVVRDQCKSTNKNQTNNNMKQKKILEAKKMAREAGYHDAKRVGTWKGYEVVEPIFTDGEMHFIGFPLYILLKDGKMRWTKDYNESLDVMDALSSKI